MQTFRAATKIVADMFRYSPAFRSGSTILVVLLILAALSVVSPYGPSDRQVVPMNLPPSPSYPFGTTALGQDVFWLTAFAIRNSLFVAGLAVVIGRSIGVLLGSFSGYTGGATDRILSSLADTFIVIPRLPLLMLIAFILKGTITLSGLAVLLGLLDWAWPSKRYRAQILSLREEEFTQTAIFAGMGSLKIIIREHLPFLIPFLLADAVSGFLYAIGMEVTLSVLGLSDLQTPTIGTMIYWSTYYQVLLTQKLWWLIAPVAAAVLLVVSLYHLSTSFSDYLDPRRRLKSLATSQGGAR
ncbi:MAG TPA: ABC transporter permease [Chloroflexota bacterium]|nr:ABC transporter permease [Chloroflexota bacterium]